MDSRVKHAYQPDQDVLDRIGINRFPDYKGMIKQDFITFDPRYRSQIHRETRRYTRARQHLQNVEKQINRRRPTGEKIRLACSRQIRIEAKWYLNRTAFFDDLEQQLQKLHASLKNQDQPQSLTWQNPEDGAFGCGYTLFHLQCDAMIEGIYTLYNDGKDEKAPEYPLTFLEPINSPEKMVNYLTPLITSDIAKTGVDNRDTIGAITGVMSQLVFKHYLRDYVRQYVKGFDLSDAWIDAYTKLLDDWQDPATGFWGQWYQHEGKLYKSPDLSLTYHTVKYRKGKVAHWDKLIDTLFAIKRCPYPFGWFVNGHMNNHNSMDVVKLFKLGWDKMSDAQKDRAREDIHEMLDWCLNDSLEPDGSFKFFPFYASQGDAFYYGAAFLDAVGYINPKNLFWTDESFPEGKAVCQKVLRRIRELGLNNRRAQATIDILERNCGCAAAPSA